MIIEATINSNKTNYLAEIYMKLRQDGVAAENILVLVQNGRKKKKFSELIKKKYAFGNIGNLNIYSFFGLARHFVEANWALVENLIKGGKPKVSPNMCGLEVSQYIFKNCIKDVEFKGYNSKINLLHQLLRRYSLIVQNALGEDEILKKERILKESYGAEVRAALNIYKRKSLDLRALDYLRQTGVFEYLYKNVKNPYKYVILDDADEITPAVFEYLKFIKPDVKEFFVAQDPYGASRLGYLSATLINFEKFLGEKVQKLEPDSKKRQEAIELTKAIKSNAAYNSAKIDLQTFIRRDEMLDYTINEVQKLIQNGEKPSEIALVVPVIDPYLKYKLRNLKQNVFFLSGSEKLNQNQLVAGIIELLKIINSKRDFFISPFVLKGILTGLFGLEYDFALELYQKYKIENFEFKKGILEFFEENKTEKIEEFLELLKSCREKPLTEQLFRLCEKYVEQKIENQNSILKLNKLAKQICDFEEIFGNNFLKYELIEQLENTIISENPLSEEEIDDNAIIVSTAQKLIDSEICAKHILLLDASCGEWIKQDIGMLYNSWVFQKNWNKETFEPKDNLDLTIDRTARILYKLYLLQNGKMHVFSSVYDTMGIENISGIDKFFKKENETKEKRTFKITPRKDQKPVLDYKGGKMAVSAVAGSGKTTIMLALIIKLLEGRILPDIKPSEIFVLTFMDSAARNFKERIKQNFPDMVELPNISTIHGLALRILKENNNYAFLGLDDNFEIVDEIRQKEIITRATAEIGLNPKKAEMYQKAISDFKNEGANEKNCKSPSFKSIYAIYQNELKENNLIDYDDLLMLALRLLETNSGVRNFYKNACKVVIEDEAQDSSPTQQKLISIIGEKCGNIIRCGDVNQAITTTFSNSDVKGFKKFIKENFNVEMNFSQRCATNILDFANSVIDFAKTKAPEAFLDIKMNPVEGKNANLKGEVETKIFEKGQDERQFIVEEIKKIRKNNPNKSIAVLLRSNWAIGEFSSFLENFNIKTHKNFDQLSNNEVFRTVLAIFNYIYDPLDKKNLHTLLSDMLTLEQYKGEGEILEFIKNNNFRDKKGAKFQLWWDLEYFLSKNFTTPYELILEILDFYFPKGSLNANGAMVLAIFEKLFQTQKTFEATVLKMREMANKTNKTIKFFEDESENKKLEDAVKIMTLHKAKGDEFDYVFIPELTNNNLGLKIEDIKLKENTKFLQTIKASPKGEGELQQEILDENYRLIYVGITRAKEKLYLSCAKIYKHYNKEEEKTPTAIFDLGQGGQNEHI